MYTSSFSHSVYPLPQEAITDDFYHSLDQLNIKYDKSNQHDIKQLHYIMNNYLSYPSDQQALIHEKSNRLGHYDEHEKRQQLRHYYQEKFELPEICQCCCCLKQQDLPFGVDLNNVETLGQATSLFFISIKYGVVMMASAFLIFSVYSLGTNIHASKNRNGDWCWRRGDCDISEISMGNKLQDKNQLNRNLYEGQTWLGLVLIIIWIILLVFKAVRQRQLQIQYDLQNPTTSDFTVMIEDFPKYLTKANLQSILHDYSQNVKAMLMHPNNVQEELRYHGNFKISSYNQAKAYYETLRSIDKEPPTELQTKLTILKNKLILMLQQRVNSIRFQTVIEMRRHLYHQMDVCLEKLRQERLTRLHQMEQKLQELNSQKPTKLIFVSFQHNFDRINLCQLNENGLFSRLKTLVRKTVKLPIEDITISRAPQPEDIIWDNIGLPLSQRILRKTFTYFCSIVLLGASLAIIYWLSLMQFKTNNKLISIGISIFITIVNLLINAAVRALTLFEKDYRNTYLQISLAIKSILFQLLNSICLTVIANYYIKNKNLYAKGGLSQDVFYFSISNAILPPLLRILDVSYYVGRLLRWWKCRPSSKLHSEGQADYNKMWEREEFEVGYEYVYVVKTLIYTAFYISLQPIISLAAFVGLILMFYAQKYVLFYRSSRPRPSSDLIDRSLSSILNLSLISYALGSLTWTNFIPSDQPEYALIPNLISLGLAILFFIVPVSSITKCFQKQQTQPMLYQDQRLFFVSQYDRLNPATRQQGIQNFLEYMVGKRQTQLEKKVPVAEIVREVLSESRYMLDMGGKLTKNLLWTDIGRQTLMKKNSKRVSKVATNQVHPIVEEPRMMEMDSQVVLDKKDDMKNETSVIKLPSYHSRLEPLPEDILRMTIDSMYFPKNPTVTSKFRPIKALLQHQDSHISQISQKKSSKIRRTMSKTEEYLPDMQQTGPSIIIHGSSILEPRQNQKQN